MSTPTPAAIRARVREFVAQNFYVPDPQQLADDTSLVESGIVDSTGVLEVLSFIERTFGITVADAEAIPANLDSIQNLAAFIARKLRPPGTGGAP